MRIRIQGSSGSRFRFLTGSGFNESRSETLELRLLKVTKETAWGTRFLPIFRKKPNNPPSTWFPGRNIFKYGTNWINVTDLFLYRESFAPSLIPVREELGKIEKWTQWWVRKNQLTRWQNIYACSKKFHTV